LLIVADAFVHTVPAGWGGVGGSSGLVGPAPEYTDEHPYDHAGGRSGIRKGPPKVSLDGTHPFSSGVVFSGGAEKEVEWSSS
jgi:hypothetical protein